MKQDNPINGLNLVHNNQQIQNLPQEIQIRNQNVMTQKNISVVRINVNNNRDNRPDGIRRDNLNNNEINIDTD